jgi:hypothetical protein
VAVAAWRDVVIRITADTSQFDAAMADLERRMRLLREREEDADV